MLSRRRKARWRQREAALDSATSDEERAAAQAELDTAEAALDAAEPDLNTAETGRSQRGGPEQTAIEAASNRETVAAGLIEAVRDPAGDLNAPVGASSSAAALSSFAAASVRTPGLQGRPGLENVRAGRTGRPLRPAAVLTYSKRERRERAMADQRKYCRFAGRMVIVGFGSIGQGVLPLLLRHVDLDPSRIVIVTADERGREEAREFGISFHHQPLTRENYRRILEPLLGRGDFLLNVSVDVSSTALIELCAQKGALYLDTCIEPWVGGYTDTTLSASKRSNYALRESAIGLRTKLGRSSPTAILTHGANPGLVSHFVKQAIRDIARDAGVKLRAAPESREDWARLAQRLSVKVIHISERDTQVANQPKQVGEFVNTWSIEGFVSEGSQPAELGWGTHERHFPADGGRHEGGSGAAIFLNRPGAATRVRSWTPLEGPFHGFLITHGESISIPDYFTVEEGGRAVYRPTVHYAYHPCDDAVLSIHELAGKNWHLQARRRLMMDEIVSGIDELGVLLLGHPRGAYWYGSQLSIEEARRLAPHNNATSLQVCAAVLAGVIWAVENPERGVTEPDEMDFERVLEITRPYLGTLTGAFSDWTPLLDRGRLFPEDVDADDPWQFKNFRVT